MAGGDLTEIYRARNVQDAALLKNRLEEEGILSTVMNSALEGGAGVDVLGWSTQPRVMVFSPDADRARRIALEYEHRSGEISGEEDSTDDGWPTCPSCGRRRLTSCPHCGTAGTDFAEGDRIPDSPLHRLLLCPTCDEPFAPQYLRRCEWCGHEFPDGVDVDSLPAERAAINQRIVFTVVILAILVFALAGYLIWLF